MKKSMIKTKVFFWTFGYCCFFSGCSQPLRTLMDLSSEQKEQKVFMKKQEAKFNLLLSDIGHGRLKIGTSRFRIVARYGSPVLEEENTLLYRKPAEFLNSPKVYLDFDETDHLMAIRNIGKE